MTSAKYVNQKHDAPTKDRRADIRELVPDASPAFADLRELIELSRNYGDFDLGMEFRSLSEMGLPSLCAQVNDMAAVSTGQLVCRYKLAEGFQELLATLRARNVDVDNLEGGSRIPHDNSSLEITPEMIKAGRDAISWFTCMDDGLDEALADAYCAMSKARLTSSSGENSQ